MPTQSKSLISGFFDYWLKPSMPFSSLVIFASLNNALAASKQPSTILVLTWFVYLRRCIPVVFCENLILLLHIVKIFVNRCSVISWKIPIATSPLSMFGICCSESVRSLLFLSAYVERKSHSRAWKPLAYFCNELPPAFMENLKIRFERDKNLNQIWKDCRMIEM